MHFRQIQPTTFNDIKSVYKSFFIDAFKNSCSHFLPKGKRLLFVIISYIIGSACYVLLYSWEEIMKEFFTYLAFTVSPISILIIIYMIYDFIKKPVDTYRILLFSQISEDIFQEVNNFSKEGKRLQNEIGENKPNAQQIEAINQWKAKIMEYFSFKDWVYYKDLFEGLETLDDVQLFLGLDELNRRPKSFYGKKHDEEMEVINDNANIELRRCLAILGYIKTEFHSNIFPSLGRIKN